MLATQLTDRELEVVQILEGLVDTRESQVGDFVKLTKLGQDRKADVVGVELRGTGCAQVLLDLLRELCQIGIGHRSALTGFPHAGNDLLARERLDDTAALDHHEARGLGCAEPPSALGALAATADREPIVTGPRVNDAAVRVPAEGAVHGGPSLEEPGTHGVTVRRQLLGIAQGTHVFGDLGESIPVIFDDLLGPQEGVCAQARGEACLPTRRQNVI